jgi:plasmid stabilization system protein ParE
MAKHSLSFTVEAEQDIRHEMQYSAKHYGKPHARAYKSGLLIAINHVSEDPLRHPTLLNDNDIRQCIYRAHSILYYTDSLAQHVVIVAVFSHHQQKLRAFLRKRLRQH